MEQNYFQRKKQSTGEKEKVQFVFFREGGSGLPPKIIEMVQCVIIIFLWMIKVEREKDRKIDHKRRKSREGEEN